MEPQDKSLNKSTILSIVILILAGAVLRLWHLDYQSLWLDEMHTMLFCDPAIGWNEYWKIIGADVHPPLHYTLLKILFSTIAYTSIVARMVSAIAGIISIWTIFLLAREIKNNQLGLIAAFLTTINYYTISFSQEARNYMLAFLLVTLSFLYLIRLLKTLKLKHSIWYGVYTLLLLYCHYYAVFVICAQIVIGIIFFLNEEKENKITFIKRFLLSAAIVAVGFSPWIPFLSSVTAVKSTWISTPSQYFMVEYFNEYFGNSDLLKPVLAICLLLYVFSIATVAKTDEKAKQNPLLLSFIICSLWILISYMLPYFRSLTALPMLYGRYTMVVLPAFIICIAYGIIAIKHQAVRTIMLVAILTLSIADIGFSKDYYNSISKSQFREMVDYVCANYQPNEPVIDEVSFIQQQYYFKKNGIQPNILAGSKNAYVDSIITPGTSLYNAKSFWIIGGHHDNQLSEDKRHLLDSNYIRLSNAQYHDAWAEYYVAKNDTGLGISYINSNDYESGNGTPMPNDGVVALWNNSIQFKSRTLAKGKYQIIVSARGTIAKYIYPNLAISLNGSKLGDLTTTKDNTIATFYWEATQETSVTFSIELTNDAADPYKNEDRNAFINFIRIKKLN